MDPLQYPVANRDKLTELYVGKHLNDLPTPAAVLDKAVVEQNCAQMRSACERLNVTFRAHVKTHKVIDSTSFLSATSFSFITLFWSQPAREYLSFILHGQSSCRLI